MFAEQVPGFTFSTLEDGMEYKVVDVPLETVKKIVPDCMQRFNTFNEVGKGAQGWWMKGGSGAAQR
jgi:hypothetical protein